ncbi:MAG: leucine-rich repeat protein [Fuerstiella sp.]
MRFLRLSLICAATISAVLSPLPVLADPVTATIPDKALDALLREILKRKAIEKETIEVADLQRIHFLNGRGRGIKDLTGLEHCTKLAEVNLSKNEITSLAPLAACVEIQSLDLSSNRISGINPLATLEKLQYLNLENNAIAEIDAVEHMKKLSSLYLNNNQIKSVAALKDLPRLHSLYLAKNQVVDIKEMEKLAQLGSLDLRNNQIVDVTPLKALTRLRWTFLSGNRIVDIAALAEMAKADADRHFAPYWRLYLEDNPLNADAEAHIETLKLSGVRVKMQTVSQLPETEPTKDTTEKTGAESGPVSVDQ